jgi:hypothetical protein
MQAQQQHLQAQRVCFFFKAGAALADWDDYCKSKLDD